MSRSIGSIRQLFELWPDLAPVVLVRVDLVWILVIRRHMACMATASQKLKARALAPTGRNAHYRVTCTSDDNSDLRPDDLAGTAPACSWLDSLVSTKRIDRGGRVYLCDHPEAAIDDA
ncbi:hypothetical protein [Acetobacter senegalensis]|uniref:Uncharacterized protein n=1 Tax=Acetobacter senegalensis TaxID=446692 RepID=A0A0U5FJP2_9PROT|nr:hypothetical protein [Acetobacter senegalensis]CEF40045.1 hypothetical protein predicted by Glimmer/Critica [Acetobacter senegalensis]